MEEDDESNKRYDAVVLAICAAIGIISSGLIFVSVWAFVY